MLDDRSSLRDSPSLVALPSLSPESAARIWGGNRVLVGNMGRDGEVLEKKRGGTEKSEKTSSPLFLVCLQCDQASLASAMISESITENAPNVDFRMDPWTGFNRIAQDKKVFCL